MEVKKVTKSVKNNNDSEVKRKTKKEQEEQKDTIVYVGGISGKNTCVLAHLKVCEDSTKDFGRPVYDKSNAKYSINKFVVVKIIDEDCNEYPDVVFGYGQKYFLNQINEKTISCYLTPKRALNEYINSNEKYDYYSDGHARRIIYQKENIIHEFFSSGNILKITQYRDRYRCTKNGTYKVWNDNKQLIFDGIMSGETVTKKTFDYLSEMENKMDELHKLYKDVSVANIENLLFVINNLTFYSLNISNSKSSSYLTIAKLLTSPTGIYCLVNKSEVKEIYDKVKNYYLENVRHNTPLKAEYVKSFQPLIQILDSASNL